MNFEPSSVPQKAVYRRTQCHNSHGPGGLRLVRDRCGGEANHLVWIQRQPGGTWVMDRVLIQRRPEGAWVMDGVWMK